VLLATLPPGPETRRMQLHQFRHSAFCEKVRLVLEAKGLDYSVVEVTPGIGQLELFRLSGQRQVPVLVDGTDVIADSTAIALHLERRHPLPALLPVDPQLRARVLLLEDWADTALASGCRLALLQAAAGDPVLRAALLPDATPALLRQLVGGLPAGLLGGVGETLGGMFAAEASQQLQRNLEQLAVLCSAGPYLVGDQLSLADLAVAAQLSLLCFPASSGVPLAGRGVTGIADNPLLAPLFRWRDQLLAPRAPA
jgi:glutathione S-transferase